MRERHPASALVFVRGIVLSTQPDGTATATGGEKHIIEPWDPAACPPEAIAYECHVPGI